VQSNPPERRRGSVPERPDQAAERGAVGLAGRADHRRERTPMVTEKPCGGPRERIDQAWRRLLPVRVPASRARTLPGLAAVCRIHHSNTLHEPRGERLMFSLRSATRTSVSALVLGASLFISVSLPAPAQASEASYDKMKMTFAQFAKMDPAKGMKMMDSDNKGYVTKEEFLKFQEKLFSNIPKQSPDRVTMEEWRKAYENTGQ